jgi:ABC-type transport system involved in multi-copper enzyme maturation permease subunit
MTLLPVIQRELRVEARHAVTYWLRVVGASALLFAAVLFCVNKEFHDQQGDRLFHVLHLTLFYAIWILVPLLVADCISRERREGTLGLLFLTPLRARDIVLAKVLAHGLKGMTACLAAIPVVIVPFLMGGVDWRIATASVLLNLTSFCWAFAAGLLASSRNRTLTSALAWAVLWAFLFFWVMVWICGVLFVTLVFSSRGSGVQLAPSLTDFAAGLAAVFSYFEMWQWGLIRMGPPGVGKWLFCYGWLLLISVLCLIGLIFVAALNVRMRWKDNPPSLQRLKIEKALFTPAYGLGLFHRWMRWMLGRNPIGWLERRTWSGRLVSWSWVAILIALFTWALDNLNDGSALRIVSVFVPALLALSIALSSVGSFRRERELGVMELLLVTPLRVGQIVSGRVRGLWGQFLPALVLLIGLWLLLTSGKGIADQWRSESLQLSGLIWLLGFTFLTMPIIGLYFSLRCRHYIVALFLTAAVNLFVPFLFVFGVTQSGPEYHEPPLALLILFLVFILAAALWFAKQSAEYRRLLRSGCGYALWLAAFFIIGNRLSHLDLLREVVLDKNAVLFSSLQILFALALGASLHLKLLRRTFTFHV